MFDFEVWTSVDSSLIGLHEVSPTILVVFYLLHAVAATIKDKIKKLKIDNAIRARIVMIGSIMTNLMPLLN